MALIAIACIMEWCLYLRPEYFRPESRHFEWRRVGISVALMVICYSAATKFASWRRFDEKGRAAVMLTVTYTFPYINQWAVADQGPSGWDLVGRCANVLAVMIIGVNLRPKWFGVRQQP